jgi:hypothetical protein
LTRPEGDPIGMRGERGQSNGIALFRFAAAVIEWPSLVRRPG